MRDLETRIEEVTPDKALNYLESARDAGVRNRSVSEGRVLMFAQLIKAGGWRVTHQGIAFDQDGKLIDGQHRLWGCVEAKKPIRVLVTRNVPADDMQIIDRGRARSLGDILYIGGEKRGAKKAGIARMIGAFTKGKGEGDPKFGRLLDSEVIAIVEKYRADLDWFVSLKVHGAFASAPIAACLVYLHSVSPTTAEALAEKVLLGTNLQRGDAIQTFRMHLLREGTDGYLRRFNLRMALMRITFDTLAKAIRGQKNERVYTDAGMEGFTYIKGLKT